MLARLPRLAALSAGCVALACSSQSASSVRDSATLATDAVGAPAAAPPPPAYRTMMKEGAGSGTIGITGGRAAQLNEVAVTGTTRDAAAAGPVARGELPSMRAEAATPATDQPDAQSLIIRVGSATLEVDSLDGGVARVRQVVQTIPGAYVANLSLESGRDQPRRATLEVKVPSAQFDRLVAGLTPIGKVEAVNVSAQEVTEEFVDVTARAENARRLEARLVDLLARRTGKLEEVLTVERELARVREEIERYDGRLRYLRTRAAFSTLAVALHEPVPVLGQRPGTNPIAEAFRESWRNFVSFVAAFISILGVLVPLAVLGLVAWRVARRFWPAPVRGTAS